MKNFAVKDFAEDRLLLHYTMDGGAVENDRIANNSFSSIMDEIRRTIINVGGVGFFFGLRTRSKTV